MTHWGWYWKIKNRYESRRTVCFPGGFNEINSFQMFKNKTLVQLVMDSADRLSLEIPSYGLKAYLQNDYSLLVQYNDGEYKIPVEKKTCNYGGFYYFFHCPQCHRRMRKLYCIKGQYMCRKCGNFGYYSQRLRTSERYEYMSRKIQGYLKNRGGSTEKKPCRMSNQKFKRLKSRIVQYNEKAFNEVHNELDMWYGHRAGWSWHRGDHYSTLMASDFWDVYDYPASEENNI